MAQRKKKPTGHKVQMLAKAHHKNEFLRKLKHILNDYCGETLYPLIPHSVLDKIYSNRGFSFKIIPDEGVTIPQGIINHIKRSIPVMGETITTSLTENGPEMTINDFVTVGNTIKRFSIHINSDDFPNSQKVKTALSDICDDENYFVRFSRKLNNLFQSYEFWYSKMGKPIYWLKYEPKVSDTGTGINNFIIVKKQVPETILIAIDGNVRPVCRVGWGGKDYNFQWLLLKHGDLNNTSTSDDKPMNVYVQSHALMRLEERVDGIVAGILHFNLFSSLQEPKVSYDYNHNMLIEYQIFGFKVGYLRADIIDEKVIIRTFLFLTQSGTPEGQLLNKNTGLKMLDKKYLAIDKLSTFMTSDIGNNMAVRKIFQDADCQCMLDLHEKIGSLCSKHPSQSTCELMLNYLRYHEKLIPEVEEEQTK